MTITIKDLIDQTFLPLDDPRRNEFIYCFGCGAKYGANKGDYFHCQDNEELVCECGEDFVLAREDVKLVIVKE